jgi:hypothetical protein
MFDIGRNDSLPVEMVEEIDSEHANMLNEFNNKALREPVYKMTVQLARGKFETLDIYLDTNAEELAYEFCREKNLDFNALNYLVSEINKLLGKDEVNISNLNTLKDYNKMKKAAIGNNPNKFNHTESKGTVLSGLDLNNKDLSITSGKHSRIPTEQSGKGIVTTNKSANRSGQSKLVSNLVYNTYKSKPQYDGTLSINKTLETKKSNDINVLQQASQLISQIKEDAGKFENIYKRAYEEEKSRVGSSMNQSRSRSLGHLTTGNRSKYVC